MSKRLKRWGVAFASAGLATAALEIGCRLAFEAPTFYHGMQFEPGLGYRMPADLTLENRDEEGPFPFILNSLGFRGPELPATGSSDPEVERLAFFGDSMWTAWAVRSEKHMGRVTEQLLWARGRSAEVYGLGCDDYGTGQELLLFERYAHRIQPDAVVLLLFLGNDILNNGLELAGSSSTAGGDYLRPYFRETGDGSLRKTYAHPLRASLRNRSRAFGLLEHRLLTLGIERDLRWLAPFANRVVLAGEVDDALGVFKKHPEGSPWSRAWRTTEDLLGRFRDEVVARDARFLVVAIPHVHQVEIGGRRLFLRLKEETLGEASAPVDWNSPQRRLSAFLAAEAIDWIDLLPLLREEVRRSNEPTFVYDGHLGSAAHGIIAQAVAQWMIDGNANGDVKPLTAEGEPASLLPPPRSMPSWLDFRENPHTQFLAQGWMDWKPDWEGTGGWGMERLGVLYLRPTDGAFVLRGFLPREAELPVQVTVGIHDIGTREASLDSVGPFELRFPCDVGFLADRYVPFFIGTDKTQPLPAPDTRRLGLVIHEAGFESAEAGTAR